MSYTFSPGTIKLLPVLFDKLNAGCSPEAPGIEQIPCVYRTESFKYVSLVREALSNRLKELETNGVPDEVYERFRFHTNAPGWVSDIGLFGLITRWVCDRWLADYHQRIDPLDHAVAMNEKDAERERRFLAEDWGIEWRSECGVIGCEPNDCRCGSRE